MKWKSLSFWPGGSLWAPVWVSRTLSVWQNRHKDDVTVCARGRQVTQQWHTSCSPGLNNRFLIDGAMAIFPPRLTLTWSTHPTWPPLDVLTLASAAQHKHLIVRERNYLENDWQHTRLLLTASWHETRLRWSTDAFTPLRLKDTNGDRHHYLPPMPWHRTRAS